MTSLMPLPLAYGGAAVGWTITAALTLLLIGLPMLYLLALTFATDDQAIERAVCDQMQYVRLKERADAYAYGKDIYGVLQRPLELEPLASAAVAAAVSVPDCRPEPVLEAEPPEVPYAAAGRRNRNRNEH